MNYSTGFWNRIAKRYAKKPVADETAYQFKLDCIRERLTPEMKVLEFGCGTGSTALVLAPLVNDYQAIDFSSAMLTIAKAKLVDSPCPHLHFSPTPLEEYLSNKADWDAIIGMSVIHLLNDPESAIKDVFNALKPGGYFFSSTACIAESMSWFRYIAPLGSALGLLPKLHVFTQQRLESYLTDTGFEIEYKWVAENNKISCFIVARKPG